MAWTSLPGSGFLFFLLLVLLQGLDDGEARAGVRKALEALAAPSPVTLQWMLLLSSSLSVQPDPRETSIRSVPLFFQFPIFSSSNSPFILPPLLVLSACNMCKQN